MAGGRRKAGREGGKTGEREGDVLEAEEGKRRRRKRGTEKKAPGEVSQMELKIKLKTDLKTNCSKETGKISKEIEFWQGKITGENCNMQHVDGTLK